MYNLDPKSCSKRLLTSLLMLLVLSAILHPAVAQDRKYTGIGDSITVGLWSEDVPTGPFPNGFSRQYASLIQKRGFSSALYRNRAVDGATTSNAFALPGQSKGVLENQVAAAVADAPDLVTLTVGGNDVKNYFFAVGAPTNPTSPTDPKVVNFKTSFQSGLAPILANLRSGSPERFILATNVPKLWLLPGVYDFNQTPSTTPEQRAQRQAAAQAALSSYVNAANEVFAAEAAATNTIVIDLFGDSTGTDLVNVSPIDGFHPSRAGHDALALKFLAASDSITEVPSLVVNTRGDDSTNVDGKTSLREAILFANSDPALSTITFTNAALGTTVFNSEPPGFIGELNLQGPGANRIVLSGNSLTPGFTVAPDAVVRISGLTLRGFKRDEGGAIFNEGALTVDSCSFRGNEAGTGGAIASSGTDSTLDILSCSFSGNSAVPTALIENATGGAIAIISNGLMSGENSTFSGNSAPTGSSLITGLNTVFLRNCTVTGNTTANGGALHGSGLTLINTIVSGNNGASGVDISHDGAGADTLAGDNNVVGTTLRVTVSGSGNKLNITNAQLGPLSDNGGPTWTHSLLPGSPAINAGNSLGAPPTDQRGLPRHRGYDVGAFEVQNVAPVTRPVASITPPRNINWTAIFDAIDDNADPVTSIVTKLPEIGTLFDGPGTTNPITGVPYTVTDSLRRVTFRSPTTGSGTIVFKANDGFLDSAPRTVRVLVTEPTAPVLTFDNPFSPNAVMPALPTNITGTVSDNGTVSDLYLRISRLNGSVREFWSPGSQNWGSTVSNVRVNRNVPNGTFASSDTLPSGANLREGSYVLTGIAKDSEGNITGLTRAFSIRPATPDTTKPTITVNSPMVSGAQLSLLPSGFSGTVNDNLGVFNVRRVYLRLSRFVSVNGVQERQFWNPVNQIWTAQLASIIRTFPNRPGLSSTWSTTDALPGPDQMLNGPHVLNALAIDAAGNTGAVTIPFDIVSPSGVIRTASAVKLSSLRATTAGTLHLAFTGALAPSSANAARYSVTVNGDAVEVLGATLGGTSNVELRIPAQPAGRTVIVSYTLHDATGKSLAGLGKTTVK